MTIINNMSFKASKQHTIKPQTQYEPDNNPLHFLDYVRQQNTRFCEICKIYLDGLSMDDIKYMRPDDLINLVPPEQFRHKLLMTILVRRYIFNDLDNQSDNDSCISNVFKHTNDSSSSC